MYFSSNETECVSCNVNHCIINTVRNNLILHSAHTALLSSLTSHGVSPKKLNLATEIYVNPRNEGTFHSFFFCCRHTFLLVYILKESNKPDLEIRKHCAKLMQCKQR